MTPIINFTTVRRGDCLVRFDTTQPAELSTHTVTRIPIHLYMYSWVPICFIILYGRCPPRLFPPKPRGCLTFEIAELCRDSPPPLELDSGRLAGAYLFIFRASQSLPNARFQSSSSSSSRSPIKNKVVPSNCPSGFIRRKPVVSLLFTGAYNDSGVLFRSIRTDCCLDTTSYGTQELDNSLRRH